MSELLYIIIGFFLGYAACGFFIRSRIRRIMRRIEQEEDSGRDTISVRLEKLGDTVLVYNRETEAFITQVKTKQEFFEYCEKNYEGKILFMRQADAQLLDTL